MIIEGLESVNRRIRLIREVLHPGGGGPFNGMWALQEELRKRISNNDPDWLAIGGRLKEGDWPWIWCWKDRQLALDCENAGIPFVAGPNVLFLNSRVPRVDETEAGILDARQCKAFFCHSAWYAELIGNNINSTSCPDLYTWPYPIDPLPGSPQSPKLDLLIYSKSGIGRSKLTSELSATVGRSHVIEYGNFKREQLFETARQSRCCVYLSTREHGGLALSELLLAGCPAVGVPEGAPLIRHGVTGIHCEWELNSMVSAIRDCYSFDRRKVASEARSEFESKHVADRVIGILRNVRGRN